MSRQDQPTSQSATPKLSRAERALTLTSKVKSLRLALLVTSIALAASFAGLILGFALSLFEFFFWQLFQVKCDPGSLSNCVTPDFAAYWVSSDFHRSLAHDVMAVAHWAGLGFGAAVVVLAVVLKSEKSKSEGTELAMPATVAGILMFLLMVAAAFALAV